MPADPRFAALQKMLSPHPAAEAGSLLVRRSRLFADGGAFVPAAVLIGFAPDAAGTVQILLSRRAGTLRHHGGQIAFPGGRREADDADAFAAAARETCEEAGVAAAHWRPLAQLPVCRTPSGFAITPVAAWADRQPETRANPAEVAELFWLPLRIALDRNCYTQRTFAWRGQTLAVPALPYCGRDIWGATALMLYYLAERAAGCPECSLNL